ncbi:hypothetical protein ILUMI_27032 [Ignelater luminosus]|uniref:Tc1-like transposase DDE domain-containing protein n=1 Tax=Ignelater luminosus TaxID=2038154 RepID=A0A8K0C5Q3_IGNLU|nr:hypothetical protein ILUMI_27032 [Ignelater luminosus]
MLVHKYGILYHCPTSGRTMVHSIKFSCSNTRPEDFLGLICFVIDTEIFVVYQMTRKYSTIDLQNAIDEVRSGAGVRTTERKYGIPHGTFMDKLHGKTSVNVRKGPSTILTNAEEELLVLWLKAMAKKGIPVSVRQVQDAVQQIIQEDNRKTSFTNDRPGRKWSAFTAATEHVIQNGFRKCGLFPFEANAIDYAKCMSDASRIIDKPCQFEPQHLLYLESVFPSGRILQFRESGEEWLGDDSAKELFYVWKKIKNIVAPSTGNEGQPATTEQEDHHLVITSTQGTQTSHVNEVTENALCGPEVTPKMFSRASSEISPAFSNSLVWPSESPVKKLNSRKKIKLPDAVGAGEWDKYWKERRETAASKAQKKKRKVGKKEKEMFISSESEDERELANSLGCKQLLDKMYSSESETDLADLMAPENTGESFEIFDVKATDFILAEFPTEGGSVARYAAQILIVNDDEVQDNDPKHTDYTVRQWILYNTPHTLPTPPHSPDLNPVEYLWDELERRIRKHHISSKTELKRLLLEEWNQIEH